MQRAKKATIYIDNELFRALRLKAIDVERTLSELVNDAVRFSLSEDAADLDAIRTRKREKTFSYAEVLASMKRNGKL